MKKSNYLIYCIILIIFLPSIKAINASSVIFNIQGNLGITAILADDGTTFNASGDSPFYPTANATDTNDNYLFSFIGTKGNQNLSSMNITDPENFTTTSTNVIIDFNYDSQEDFAFLNCYYLLNRETDYDAENVTFPCNSSNVSITFQDEQYNDLEFFINDSMPQVFGFLYKYWTNASGTGTPDEGGGGGGGSVITNPETRPTIDPLTNETMPSGYKEELDNYFKQYMLWTIDALRQVLKETGSTIMPAQPAFGLLIIFLVIFALGLFYKKSDRFFGWLGVEIEDEQDQRYHYLKNKYNLTSEEKAFIILYEKKRDRNLPKSPKKEDIKWQW